MARLFRHSLPGLLKRYGSSRANVTYSRVWRPTVIAFVLVTLAFHDSVGPLFGELRK